MTQLISTIIQQTVATVMAQQNALASPKTNVNIVLTPARNDRQVPTYFKCRQVGHISHYCPQNPPAPKTSPIQPPSTPTQDNNWQSLITAVENILISTLTDWPITQKAESKSIGNQLKKTEAYLAERYQWKMYQRNLYTVTSKLVDCLETQSAKDE